MLLLFLFFSIGPSLTDEFLGLPIMSPGSADKLSYGIGRRNTHDGALGGSRLSRSVDTLPMRTIDGTTMRRNGNRSIQDGPITIGVCAMEKKAKSGPMMEILNRITAFTFDRHREFKVIHFAEETILMKPIEQWPLCEALIAFYSQGFPLRKAQAYAALRRPHVFNDLEKQELLFDRRRVYTILKSVGVPTPKYVVFDAASDPSPTVNDSDEWLEINGVRISKPLVEKPISGEDHNIYIYYPRSQGGGSKRLFRKVGDRSGQFCTTAHDIEPLPHEPLPHVLNCATADGRWSDPATPRRGRARDAHR